MRYEQARLIVPPIIAAQCKLLNQIMYKPSQLLPCIISSNLDRRHLFPVVLSSACHDDANVVDQKDCMHSTADITGGSSDIGLLIYKLS